MSGSLKKVARFVISPCEGMMYMAQDRPNRFFSRRQEVKTAAIIGGKPQPNSGATALKKGDVKGQGILIDSKTLIRPQKSHTIKREWLDKIEEEAFEMGCELSALNFDFGDNGRQYFILDERHFRALYHSWLELRGESDNGGRNTGED